MCCNVLECVVSWVKGEYRPCDMERHSGLWLLLEETTGRNQTNKLQSDKHEI